jgi:hypothetical protein
LRYRLMIWASSFDSNSFYHLNFNGLVDGKIYRKPWFLPWNIGLSCRLSLKPIQWPL